jgi:hypothetical protein
VRRLNVVLQRCRLRAPATQASPALYYPCAHRYHPPSGNSAGQKDAVGRRLAREIEEKIRVKLLPAKQTRHGETVVAETA